MITLLQLGTVDYATGLALQQKLVALRKEEKIGDVLLLLEHKPVITLGRNAKAANVIAGPELLAQRGVAFYECDRGGDVTFHGPGQLVGYPIFDLRNYATGAENGAADALVRRASAPAAARQPQSTPPSERKHLGAVDFVRRLEEVLIRTCADFAIPTKRIEGLTGVWADAGSPNAHVGTGALARPVEQRSTENLTMSSHLDAKLAAIGIHISHFVTSHGFALNINTDLSYFNLIIPCGITTKPVTSMQQKLGRELDLNAVAQSITRNFGTVFSSQILWLESLDALLGQTTGVPMQPPKELRQLHQEDDTTWA